ncbi:MAG: dCTP deaminase, partial [candidate division Zixibacteria bacterium]|nr:dCTP deaminase [candidate division Zixibacteria bacterium]
MSVKSDRWIAEMAKNHDMIKPFSETQIRRGISY